MYHLALILLICLVQSASAQVLDGLYAKPTPEQQIDPKYIQALRDLRLDGDERPLASELTDDPCMFGVPDALSFIEPLKPNLKPSEVVLFSGGDSYQRRTSGFGAITSEQFMKLAAYHGYQLVFLDELDYDRKLIVNGTHFAPLWHKTFAFKSLRARFPHAKYYVWLDDDILSLFPESDMLNHYINIVEADSSIELLIGDDTGTNELNAGMYIVRNTEFIAELMQKIILMGLEDNGFLAKYHYHEQDGLRILRKRHNLQAKIPIIKHRTGPYHFNTYHNIFNFFARPLDTFVHHVCCTVEQKEAIMKDRLKWAQSWREKMPKDCIYPVNIPTKFI